ncbi:MAG: hypothetical protein K5927_06615 [Lachnospiraceae bacterium]|jgi:hypothetical protein|nr:hypothetical protein [Lachnospiraceae bacterium]
MKIERTENSITWKYLFSGYSIPLLPETEFIYVPKKNRIYVKNIIDQRLEITVYNMRAEEIDKRTYSHYFVNFFEKDGFACMKYYDYSMQSYCTASFIEGAGISGIVQVQG